MDKRNSQFETVLRILEGQLTDKEAAKLHDVSVEEIAKWRQSYGTAFRKLANGAPVTDGKSRSGFRRKLQAAAIAVGIFTLGLGAAVAAPSDILSCNDNDAFFCFDPNSPARASEVNHNFAKMAGWVENAVGPVDAPAIDSTTAGTTAIDGTVSADSAEFSNVDVDHKVTAGSMELTYSAIVGRRMSIGSDFTADTDDGDTDNDYDLNVDGDAVVKGNLRVDGSTFANLLTVSGRFSADAGSTSKTMTETTNSICFLVETTANIGGYGTYLTAIPTTTMGEVMNCNIVQDNGSWVLEFYSFIGETSGSSCAARCISW